ncbi:hypothetical protein COU77_03725, partial [Candidatus Peregrinibacteria bacterium CG10_big_fil_rev_8_21_14_0_10_49_16]
MSPIAVTAVYKFLPLRKEELPVLQKELTAFGKEHGMRGLTLLAEEGVNATVCGKPEVIEEWKTLLTKHFGEMVCKDSEAEELVFPRWFVKIRTEIVGLKKSEIRPDGRYQHLTPEEWDKMMEEEDIVVLDARNIYETDIGMFEGAVDPRLREFSDFPEYVKTCGISKDKKVLMYCTGGIRCEKALIEMEQQGYEHVYQLEGGILAYLKKFPHRKFKGECFIFDHRTALDQELKQSSRYRTCPHCGDPGDIEI